MTCKGMDDSARSAIFDDHSHRTHMHVDHTHKTRALRYAKGFSNSAHTNGKRVGAEEMMYGRREFL